MAAYEKVQETSVVHQAFWRWHFYAGVIVMPVLMLMALTGALYLYQPEIERLLYPTTVEGMPTEPPQSPSMLVSAAVAETPGQLAQLLMPAGVRDAAKVTIASPAGERRTVFVDPYSARVLGGYSDGGLLETVKRLHSLEIAGPISNIVVEIVAGWSIILVATGLVLWWPRGQTSDRITVRGRPSTRVFWRDLHALTGASVGLVIVFLAVTGMPWSAVWGKEVRRLVNDAGVGRPAAPASDWGHEAHRGSSEQDGLPWTLQGSPLQAKLQGDRAGLDAAVDAAERAGLARPYALNIPATEGQAWTASHTGKGVEQTRTLYIDPHSGKVVGDVRFEQFGAGAKAIEWGISVHQGRQYGEPNRILMLTGCLGILFLGISSLTMWLKRRPKGSFGAPRRLTGRRSSLALALVVTPLALIYPLVGASIITVCILDAIYRAARSARSTLGTTT